MAVFRSATVFRYNNFDIWWFVTNVNGANILDKSLGSFFVHPLYSAQYEFASAGRVVRHTVANKPTESLLSLEPLSPAFSLSIDVPAPHTLLR